MNVMARLRAFWLFTIKHSLNHLTSSLARRGVPPFTLVRHVGRRSGKQYETPIIAQPLDDGFMIALTYGPQVDWYKNVRAAGGCRLLRRGTWYTVTRLEPVDGAVGRHSFAQPTPVILGLLGIDHFVKFITEQEATT